MSLRAFVLSLILLHSVTFASPVFGKGKQFECDFFSITIPAGMTMEKTSGDDFDVLRFSIGDQFFFAAYCGNFPDYPLKKDTKHELRQSKIGNLEMQTEWDGDRMVSKEMKILLIENIKSWPAYIHFFSKEAMSKDELAIVERAFSSIKMKNPPKPKK